MVYSPKNRWLWFSVLVAIILVALSASIYVNYAINSYKPRASDALNQYLGLKSTIKDPLEIHWLGGPALSIRKILLQDELQTVATLDQLVLEMKLLPLLKGQILVKSLTLNTPRVTITSDQLARLVQAPLFTSSKPADNLGQAMTYTIRNGFFQYEDKQKKHWVMENLNLDARTQLPDTDKHQQLSLKAWLKMDSAYGQRLRAENLVLVISASNGHYRAILEQARVAEGYAKGTFESSVADAERIHKLDLDIQELNIEQSLQAMGNDKIVSGLVNMSAKLTSSGKNIQEIRHHLDGTLKLEGGNLVIETMDLDKALDQYSKSQRFNLVDLGAYIFVGPLGTVATKSYDFAGITRAGKNGKGAIRKIKSHWNIRDGIASAHDVAFLTRRHRVALKGSVNIADNKLGDLKLAVIDDNGCAIYSQQLGGSLETPELKSSGTLKPLLGPVVHLLKKPGELLAGKQCDPFYTGELMTLKLD